MKVIARIHNGFQSKFGVPRQSGLSKTMVSTIVFEPEFRNPDALRGLEEFSHLWLIWNFSECHYSKWSPTVRPPRLGGNKRIGVFATRSPNRPNPIGLTSVRLADVQYSTPDGPIIKVFGADLMNNTPIYDIKPYIPYADSHPDASGSYADEHYSDSLEVVYPDRFNSYFSEDDRAALIEILSQDPRPAYHSDPEREYGFLFSGYDVRFTVDGRILSVSDIIKSD